MLLTLIHVNNILLLQGTGILHLNSTQESGVSIQVQARIVAGLKKDTHTQIMSIVFKFH